MITTALQYGGGKDSRAILHMYREQLDDILVVWCDTGASYPEVVAEMETMPAKVPHFLTVKSNQPAQIAENGYPSDVVPVSYTPLGREIVTKTHHFRIQGAFDCCAANIWWPMAKAMRTRSIKRIIRGQRLDEQYKSSIRHGHIDSQGIEYVMPLENWTANQVFAYLKENNVEIPAYYATEVTSHDCWDCTAYLGPYERRIANLPIDKKAEVIRRLAEIDRALALEMVPLKNILEHI